jgi:hypothetical protein
MSVVLPGERPPGGVERGHGDVLDAARAPELDRGLGEYFADHRPGYVAQGRGKLGRAAGW